MNENSRNAKILRSSAIVFAFTIAGMFSKYVFISFAVKVFPQSAFGRYSLAFSLTSFVSITGLLGMHLAQDRFIPVYRSNDELGKVRSLITVFFPVAFAISFVTSFALYYFSTPIAIIFGTIEFAPILRLFSFAVVGFTMLELTTYAYRGFEKPLYFAVFKRFGLNFITLAVCLALFLVGLEVTALYLAFPVATLLLASTILVLFYRRVYLNLPSGSSIDIQRVFSYSWPYTFSKTASIFLVYADILFVGYFLTSNDVAIYRIAIVLSGLILLPLMAVVPIYKPLCSKHLNNGNDRVNAVYNFVIRVCLSCGGILIVGYALTGRGIISLVSTPEYQSGVHALVILSVGNGIKLMFGPTGPTLQSTDYSQVFLKISLAKVVGNVVLNLILIPVYGLIGAALATAASRLIGEVAIYSFIRGSTPIKIEVSQLLRLGTVLGATYVLGGLARWMIHFSGYVETLSTLGVIGVTFMILAYRIVVTKDDMRLAREVLSDPVVSMISRLRA